ncbi:SMI1/KNR4 family protein [Actinoplanes sp. NPDC048796]|uniref:SMI1/KNR4 family protein n=1 Tax=unclassified Actinoplanes TaxID=2626549 RepID=UPI0033D39AD3
MELLLETLRARAYDPAWRFDDAPVPVEWATRHYGEISREGRAFRSDGMVFYAAGAVEAIEYYRDAPRGPLHPPATAADVENAERQIGRPLPELLRRLYREVADGGFGPGPRGFTRIDEVGALHRRDREHGRPESWFELAPGGCTMYWYTDFAKPGNPVLLYDADGWDPHDGESPRDGVRQVTPSLHEWLGTWAEGGDIWAAARKQ